MSFFIFFCNIAIIVDTVSQQKESNIKPIAYGYTALQIARTIKQYILIKYKRPMGHIAHLRKLFKSINNDILLYHNVD